MSHEIRAGKTDIAGAFMQLYLTLISVVQGAVAGYLASVVNDVYSSLSVSQWILIGATFLQIVAIWHSYAMGTVISAWIPTLADSIIPFTYGAAQILVVGAVRSTEQSWVRAMVILNAAGVLAYVNHIVQTSRSSSYDS
jgi:hypothetical protein